MTEKSQVAATVNEGGAEQVSQTMKAFIETARADNAFGQPVEHEGQLIIPASEVMVVQGFGLGYGSGTDEGDGPEEGASSGEGGGGGGGGRTLSRPVAVIVASKDQVRVEPIIDITKLGVTLLTALGAMALASSKMLKRAKDLG